MTGAPEGDAAPDSGPDEAPLRLRSLISIIACVAVAGMGWGVSTVLLGAEMSLRGISGTVIGLHTAMGAVAIFFAAPFLPRIIRAIGFKATLFVALGLSGASLLAFNLSDDLTFWFLNRLILGGGLAALFVATEAWIGLTAREETRGRTMGIYGSALAAGFGSGALIYAGLGSDGWQPYLAGATAFALAALVLTVSGGRAPVFTPDQQPSKLWPVIKAAPTVMAAAAVFGAIEMGIFAFLGAYGVRAGLTEAVAGSMLAAAAFGQVALQVPLGALADIFDRRAVLIGCAVVAGLAGLMVPMALDAPLFLYPLMVAMGAGAVGLYTLSLILAGQRFRGQDLVAANAGIALTYGVGSLIGPILTGIAMDLYDPHGLMWALTALTLSFAALALWRGARTAPSAEAPKRR